MVGGQTQFSVLLTKGKCAAWEDGRQLEKGNMKMDFRRKLSDNEIWRKKLMQQGPKPHGNSRLASECSVSGNPSQEQSGKEAPDTQKSPCIGDSSGQRVTQWMSAPYLSFPTCRENAISCTFFSYFRFSLLLDTFDLFDCHGLCPWLHSGKEIAQLGCYIENQVGHKQDLYFAFGHFVSHMGVFSH